MTQLLLGHGLQWLPLTRTNMRLSTQTDAVLRLIFVLQPQVEATAKQVTVYWLHKANGSYTRMSGTSQAAPHVAGLAATLMEKFTSLTAAQIATRIKTTASYDGLYRSDGVAASSLSVSARQAILVMDL